MASDSEVRVFSSKKCPACKEQDKQLKKLKGVKVRKVDVDTRKGNRIADREGVTVLPTVDVCRKGKCRRVRGAATAEKIRKGLR